MSAIDSTARVAPGARIGDGASIGPYCVVGPDVIVGEGCRLIANVHVAGHTTIGARTIVYPFASLGTPPQSGKYRGGPTRLVIGADCDIRENVTINTGTEDDRGVTEIGDRCFLMAGSHVAHDCKVGSDVTFANNAVLGGHVSIGDRSFLGGQAAVRQFVRIGEGAMIVGLSGVRADIIPWGMAQGPLANLVGINVIGLRRGGFAGPQILRLRAVYRALFLGDGMFRDRLARAEEKCADDRLVGSILAFIRSGTRPLANAIRRTSTSAEQDA
ncbi:MAG TPA: acyl-ACP--UDP-N-acetylglucosamine O-acyltransferase [Xanthobacteraceae bacterium]|nr:acyl-ACP--UDP-N-acetylglucosamine O-acyltransferase [Xanthobacteraceae bacterium]